MADNIKRTTRSKKVETAQETSPKKRTTRSKKVETVREEIPPKRPSEKTDATAAPTIKKRTRSTAKTETGSEIKTVQAKRSEKPSPRKAGRPKGTGKYGEETRSVRVPVSMIKLVPALVERSGMQVPLYHNRVQAGFPSPALDSVCETLDIAQYLIPNPASTFFLKVAGESMRDAGVFPDDILIVDRSEEPRNGDVVVAAVDGEFTVKRLFKTDNRVELRPENKLFSPIVITEESELIVWGVVRKVIHNV